MTSASDAALDVETYRWADAEVCIALEMDLRHIRERLDFREFIEPQACEPGEEKPVEARKAKDRSARPKLNEIGYGQRQHAQDKARLLARNPFMRG